MTRYGCYMQKQLGYSDEEMAEFKADPRNQKVLEKGLELAGKTFVAEVVDSHGCASGHRVGDKIYFDGAGNLLAKHAPKRCCILRPECAERTHVRGHRGLPGPARTPTR